MEQNIRLAVRKLVEFILQSGDIDSRYAPRDRMAEGTRLHRALQKKSMAEHESYQAEVKLSGQFVHDGLTYTLEGRADGIYTDNGKTVIDEIKTTNMPLEFIDDSSATHWAQAQCYACIYALQNDLTEMSIRLTYANYNTDETKYYFRSYTLHKLKDFIDGLLEKYTLWARMSADWQRTRDETITALAFPFPEYRKGQRQLAVAAYRTITGGTKLYAQAPTGTGKTISALFPAVKAMGEGHTSKIFYLTAKTITRQVAEEALEKMRKGGLRLKTLTLTAKEKICFCETAVCRPEVCQYAKGYFDRANDAVYDAITSCDTLTRSVIEEFAEKHTVCPFELSLDLSLWVDCVICDYNYVFDPRAYLRRFFADGAGDYVFLIDEAHNLVDRAREMFSAQLTKTQFYEIKKHFKKTNNALDKILNSINKSMIEYRKDCNERGFFVTPDAPEEFIKQIREFTGICELLLKENAQLSENNDFLQLYFDALNFTLMAEFYDERYVTFVQTVGNDVSVRLFCLDPSFLLSEALERGSAAVFFSATLTPLQYFRTILGGQETDKLLALDSPFDSEKLCLLAADRISTTYKNREQSIGKISQMIAGFTDRKTGNYIVYFPSYKYMRDVFSHFAEAYPHINAVMQDTSMTEEAREEFLDRFALDPSETLVAFCVLGGIFSEGIDLKGNRLIGSVIVSVGLPQLSVQQDIIKDYFSIQNGMGFEFAYMYPGMNKVLQAAGRVIRCEADVGAVLLIDERFGRRDYVNLFPRHWQNCRPVRNSETLKTALDAFWTGND